VCAIGSVYHLLFLVIFIWSPVANISTGFGRLCRDYYDDYDDDDAFVVGSLLL